MDILTIIGQVEEAASHIDAVGNLLLILAAARYFRQRQWVKINLSCGSFKILRKDVNASNMTNVVSEVFYVGDRLPANVRQEIIQVTNPKIKEVSKPDGDEIFFQQ